jgi:hypothetical protein
VHEERRAGNVNVRAAQTILNSVRKIIGCRKCLAASDPSFIVDCNEIGKGAPYINCDSHEAFQETIKIRCIE